MGVGAEAERQIDGSERLAYRPAELAGMVGMSAKAIYRAIERGELRAAKVSNGTRLLIPASEAMAWLEENLVEVRGGEALPSRRVRPRPSELRPLPAVLRNLDLT